MLGEKIGLTVQQVAVSAEGAATVAAARAVPQRRRCWMRRDP